MITLRNREGTRVELDLTREVAAQIAPALAKGWALVETVEQEIIHEAPSDPPARTRTRSRARPEPAAKPARARKPRAAAEPKTERPKRTRTVRIDDEDQDAAARVLTHIRANPGLRAEQIAAALRIEPKRALDYLRRQGAINTTGKARGTTYTAAPDASAAEAA